jgi:hypothetical protein
MSKKLIAAAAAAALSLAGLVAIPTVATAAVGPFSVAQTGAATNSVSRDGSTAVKALQVNVPSDDVIRTNTDSVVATGNTSNSTAMKFAVVTPGATDSITVTSTGGVKVLTATQYADTTTTSATGTQSLTVPAADGLADVYAYTTTTAGGTVVVSAAGSSKTYNIVGLSVTAYKMAFTLGATAAIGGKYTLTGTVKDAFGNDLTTALVASDFHTTILGGSAADVKKAVTTANFAYNATTKVYTITGLVRDSAGSQAVSLEVNTVAIRATKVTAFGDPVLEAFFTVNPLDLGTQVTVLTAQVASLQAQLAALQIVKDRKVSKLKYNRLARKWNAAFPSNKVWVKP